MNFLFFFPSQSPNHKAAVGGEGEGQGVGWLSGKTFVNSKRVVTLDVTDPSGVTPGDVMSLRCH